MAEAAQPDGWWKHCSACGVRIGIYEPVIIDHPDGIRTSSYLNLDPLERVEAWRFFHSRCINSEHQLRHGRVPD
jgi:hypothetical protein